MRQLASKIVEFLEATGIDGVVFMVVLGLVLLLVSVRNLRTWDDLLYYEKWMVAMEAVASLAVTLAGCLLLLGRVL
jgi:hypothetical protein